MMKFMISASRKLILVAVVASAVSAYAVPIGGSCASYKYENFGGQVYGCALTGETFFSCTYGCVLIG